MARPPLDNSLKFNLPDGTVVTAQEMLRKIQEAKAAERTQQRAAPDALPEADLQTLLDALLLLGGTASINAVLQWLSLTGRERAHGEAFDHYATRDGLQALVAQRRAEGLYGKGTRVSLADHAKRLQTLLAAPGHERYWRQRLWLLGSGRGDWQDPIAWVNFRNAEDMRTVLRLMIFSGMPAAEYRELINTRLQELSPPMLAMQALIDPWCPRLLGQIDPELRDDLLGPVAGRAARRPPHSRRAARLAAGRHPGPQHPDARASGRGRHAGPGTGPCGAASARPRRPRRHAAGRHARPRRRPLGRGQCRLRGRHQGHPLGQPQPPQRAVAGHRPPVPARPAGPGRPQGLGAGAQVRGRRVWQPQPHGL